jgi:hypothetical protein
MIDFQKVSLTKIIIHRVGNKSIEEGYKLSDNTIDLQQSPDLADILKGFFLKPFEETPFYNFSHPTSIDLNEIYTIARTMFASGKNFVKDSKDIGRLLYEYSVHPKIKNGELYIVYFKSCLLENVEMDAIGIFKSENKDTFLKLVFDGNDYQVGYEDGVNINKLDKGCLIFNTNKDNGYIVASVDNISRSVEAQYWKDEFLKLRPSNDNYHATQHYLDACKNFVTNQLEQEYEINKTDKISYLNKTVEYFKQNDEFDEDSFLETVFEDTEVIKSFTRYKEEYLLDTGVELENTFEISNMAVKKQARVFKSVLKLDKNFHVYIHGDKSLIEKGFDEKLGKSFYKIYFDEES